MSSPLRRLECLNPLPVITEQSAYAEEPVTPQINKKHSESPPMSRSKAEQLSAKFTHKALLIDTSNLSEVERSPRSDGGPMITDLTDVLGSASNQDDVQIHSFRGNMSRTESNTSFTLMKSATSTPTGEYFPTNVMSNP